MPHSTTALQCRCRDCLLAASAGLFELRDAFVELSLALKDLQFEADDAMRRAAEKNVQQLLINVSTRQLPPVPPPMQ
jgi:hypothetical protein